MMTDRNRRSEKTDPRAIRENRDDEVKGRDDEEFEDLEDSDEDPDDEEADVEER
jgi:hypothetical protein